MMVPTCARSQAHQSLALPQLFFFFFLTVAGQLLWRLVKKDFAHFAKPFESSPWVTSFSYWKAVLQQWGCGRLSSHNILLFRWVCSSNEASSVCGFYKHELGNPVGRNYPALWRTLILRQTLPDLVKLLQEHSQLQMFLKKWEAGQF